MRKIIPSEAYVAPEQSEKKLTQEDIQNVLDILGSLSKNHSSKKVARALKEAHEKELFDKYISESAGKEVKMSDRSYIIAPDGSYRRVKN